MLNIFLRKILCLLFLICCEGCGVPFSDKIESLWKTCISEEEMLLIDAALKSVEQGDQNKLDVFFQQKLSLVVNEKGLECLVILGNKIEGLIEDTEDTSEMRMDFSSVFGETEEIISPSKTALIDTKKREDIPKTYTNKGNVVTQETTTFTYETKVLPNKPQEENKNVTKLPPINHTFEPIVLKKADILDLINKSGIDNIEKIANDLLRSIAIYLYKRDQIIVSEITIPLKYIKEFPSAENMNSCCNKEINASKVENSTEVSAMQPTATDVSKDTPSAPPATSNIRDRSALPHNINPTETSLEDTKEEPLPTSDTTEKR